MCVCMRACMRAYALYCGSNRDSDNMSVFINSGLPDETNYIVDKILLYLYVHLLCQIT